MHVFMIQDFIVTYYFWFKSFHIIAVMAWMAGLLYLPRLFVYHVDATDGSELSETLKIMERRLMRFIMNPSMIVAWIFGLSMIFGYPDILENIWMHVKLSLVVILTVVHALFSRWRKAFACDENYKSAKFFRIWNEVPTVIMIIAVIMVVAQPF